MQGVFKAFRCFGEIYLSFFEHRRKIVTNFSPPFNKSIVVY